MLYNIILNHERKSKMKRSVTLTKTMIIGLLIICGFMAFNIVNAQGKDSVLVVQSYHTGYAWVDSINNGVKKGFEGSGINVEYFYMDTKRKTDEAWKVESGKLAEAKMKELKPKVVITVDDNAQQYFAKNFAGKADAPQFVFCGVNSEAAKYGFPADNVTGILERPHFLDSIDMLLKIKPGIKKLGMISDNSETSDAVFAYIKTLKPAISEVIYKQPATLDEWKKTIEEFQKTVDAIGVYNYNTVKKALGEQSLDPKEVIKVTNEINKLPTVAFLEFGIEDGCLFGIAESGEEHGFQSAEIAKQMIKGKKAKDFPITTAKKGVILFNTKTAEKLKIDIPFDMLKSADKVFDK